MRLATILSSLLLVPCLAGAQQPTRPAKVSPQGFVPDSATAVRIAVAVWIPLYGESTIMAQQPITAKLQDSVWTVTGRLVPSASPVFVIDGNVVSGSALAAKISQRDGRILQVSLE
jgi:NTF2 fold immunity protein